MRRLVPIAVPFLTAFVLVLPLVACESSGTAGSAASSGRDVVVYPPGVPDARISLRRASVFDTVAPESYEVPQTDPGRNDAVARAHAEAPPVIPHGIDGMLPITQDDNLCVDCHGDRSDGRVGPLMPPSHFTDLRAAPNDERDEVVPARWMCLSCHLPVSTAPPLVGNSGGAPFRPSQRGSR